MRHVGIDFGRKQVTSQVGVDIQQGISTGGGVIIPEDEGQERTRETKGEDRHNRASKAHQEYRLASNIVRTAVPINCGGRLCGVVNGYLSLPSDASHFQGEKETARERDVL
jgi:hypothetical protein